MTHSDTPANICVGQDEASAPAPIQSPRSTPCLEDTTLQQTRPSTSAGQNVTAAAPVLHSPGTDSPTGHASSIRTPPSLELFDVVSGTTETATPPAAPEREKGNILPLLHTMSWLIFFSILGTLARLGLSGLTTYPGSPIGGVIWAQFAGCVLMGFLIEDLHIFALRPPRKRSSSPGSGSGASKELAPRSKATLPLYLGLTTGFCGSLTSFSSFLLATFELLSNTAPAYGGRPTKGYNLLAALAYLIGTLSLSFSGLQFGAQLALFAQPLLPSIPYRTATTLDWIAVPLSVGGWVGIVAMTVLVPRWREEALMACVFAPLGVGVRFWVSRWLNARVRTFPVGTFAVNVVGTAVLAGLVVGRYRVVGAGTGCGVLRGWGDGFCGCLTTVSTFVVEVRGLRREWLFPIWYCVGFYFHRCWG